MKQYLTPEQTAKLIELGFEKPKSISSIQVIGDILTTAEDLIGEPPSVMGGKITANYSIGELIEMLPKGITQGYFNQLHIDFESAGNGGYYVVRYQSRTSTFATYKTVGDELIDALYDMIIFLNKGGVL